MKKKTKAYDEKGNLRDIEYDMGFPEIKLKKESLTNKGKQELFTSLDEYINTKIDIRTLHIRPSLNQEQVEQRYAKASKDLYEKILALKLMIENGS